MKPFGSITQDQLAAFYRDANVALITPLRDGMNLVAKEFVACQDDKDPGVLILSPFAGAGGLMQEALQVNTNLTYIYNLEIRIVCITNVRLYIGNKKSLVLARKKPPLA